MSVLGVTCGYACVGVYPHEYVQDSTCASANGGMDLSLCVWAAEGGLMYILFSSASTLASLSLEAFHIISSLKDIHKPSRAGPWEIQAELCTAWVPVASQAGAVAASCLNVEGAFAAPRDSVPPGPGPLCL